MFEARKTLPGGLDATWRVTAPEVCLTGLAQMAIVWFLLGRARQDLRLTNCALKACDWLLLRQEPPTSPPHRRGALAGSWPIWGNYISMAYPNWSAKFLMEALQLYIQEEQRLLRGI